MKFKFNKYIVSIPALAISIVSLFILFYPIINPFIFITGTMNYKATDYYKFVDYNPFRPVFVTRPAPDQLRYKTYQRISIFEFKEINNEVVVILKPQITNTEINNTLSRTDLRNDNFDEEKYASTYKENQLIKIQNKIIQDEMDKKMLNLKKTPECRDLFYEQKGVPGELPLFFDLKFGTDVSQFTEYVRQDKFKNIISSPLDDNKNISYQFNIKSTKIFKLIISFSENFKTNPETKITKLVLVDRDCNQTQIPTKPDGTFDFEAVRSKW